MLRTVKPRNARSKRAMDAREPKEVEDARMAIFVRGTHTGEVVAGAMKELMALKRPYAISFSKKNELRPFEPSGAASLEFFASKNDASLFLIGQSTKKRPNGLTFVRMFDNRILDMCEVGVDGFVSMAEFKTPKSTPGHKPLMHFASDLFLTHPRFIQLKSLLLDFFNGEVVDSICLAGLECIISVSLGPTPASLTTATAAGTANMYPNRPVMTQGGEKEDLANLPKVHIRTYTTTLLSSGTKIPRVALTPMGPSMDLSLRRHQPADASMLSLAMKRPKMKKGDVEKGLGKKRKNLEVDEMGDLRGRVHVGRQELSGLQTRKMKGLKKGNEEEGGEDGEGGAMDWEEEGGDAVEAAPQDGGGAGRRKKRKTE